MSLGISQLESEEIYRLLTSYIPGGTPLGPRISSLYELRQILTLIKPHVTKYFDTTSVGSYMFVFPMPTETSGQGYKVQVFNLLDTQVIRSATSSLFTNRIRKESIPEFTSGSQIKTEVFSFSSGNSLNGTNQSYAVSAIINNTLNRIYQIGLNTSPTISNPISGKPNISVSIETFTLFANSPLIPYEEFDTAASMLFTPRTTSTADNRKTQYYLSWLLFMENLVLSKLIPDVLLSTPVAMKEIETFLNTPHGDAQINEMMLFLKDLYSKVMGSALPHECTNMANSALFRYFSLRGMTSNVLVERKEDQYRLFTLLLFLTGGKFAEYLFSNIAFKRQQPLQAQHSDFVRWPFIESGYSDQVYYPTLVAQLINPLLRFNKITL